MSPEMIEPINEEQCKRVYTAIEDGIRGEAIAVPDLLDVLARFVAAAILAAPSVKQDMAVCFGEKLTFYLNEFERPEKVQ